MDKGNELPFICLWIILVLQQIMILIKVLKIEEILQELKGDRS
jgi:hypothetical protein